MLRLESRLWSGYALPPPALQPLRVIVAGHGRSLQDLLATLATFQSTETDLFVHQQAIDTTTPAGKALFGMCGEFAEFERSIITDRVKAGVERCQAARETSGKIITKSGKWFGNQTVAVSKVEQAKAELAKDGASIRKVAAIVGLSVGKVCEIRQAMAV